MDNQFDNEYRQEHPFPPRYAPEPQAKKRGGSIVALALCFSLLGSILGAGGVLLASGQLNRSPEPDTSSQGPSPAFFPVSGRTA